MHRFRFSIRTMLVMVTLAALYFGCWEMTKKWGLPTSTLAATGDIYLASLESPFDHSPAPFIISRNTTPISYSAIPRREYYLWFFGYHRRLFEREIVPPRDIVDPMTTY